MAQGYDAANVCKWVVSCQAAIGTERLQSAGPLPVNAQGDANVRYWVGSRQASFALI